MDALEPFCVDASLADQLGVPAGGTSCSGVLSLAIALGANLPSPAGSPLTTFLAVRPLLQERLGELLQQSSFLWSPLFRTAPVGGPPGQPNYLNAAVLVHGEALPDEAAALEVLVMLQGLERRFARQRREFWGPRSLDLDLLWWGELTCRSAVLELPHPRLQERTFVLAPLAAIAPGLKPPGALLSAVDLLARRHGSGSDPAPVRLAGVPGWPE